MKPKVLIIEDDTAASLQLQWALGEDYEILLAQDRASALNSFRVHRPTVSLLDLGLPPHADDPSEGLAVLADIRRLDHSAKVIVFSGLGGKDTAIRAVGAGAHDFLQKPVRIHELKYLLRHCEHVDALERQYRESSHGLQGEQTPELLGRSPAMKEVLDCLGKLAPTEASALFVGESGTGKAMAARAIHRQSSRSSGPFVVLDCSALPEDLLERDLFGQERDPVSGAHRPQPGRIELAAGGTLFLKGVNALSPRLQVKLCLYLHEHVLEHVGGGGSLRPDVRVIAALNADLAPGCVPADLREDLFYQLGVVVIRMPALRERPEDLPLLAQAFLERFALRYGRPKARIEPAALRELQRYDWPGNVRELEIAIKRAVIMSEREWLTLRDFDLPTRQSLAGLGSPRPARPCVEKEVLLKALRRHHDKIAPAAAELGISRPTFYAWMERLGLRRANRKSSEADPDNS